MVINLWFPLNGYIMSHTSCVPNFYERYITPTFSNRLINNCTAADGELSLCKHFVKFAKFRRIKSSLSPLDDRILHRLVNSLCLKISYRTASHSIMFVRAPGMARLVVPMRVPVALACVGQQSSASEN
jgi:hypothetical protein